MEFLNRYLFGTAVPCLLMVSGLYYIILLRGFPFIHPIKTIRQMFCTKPAKGEISPFRALALALAGTLGVGNMVGVASAIYLGGFGAIFWMWVSALAAMMLKYAEIVLALLYRKQDREGTYHGGAMYYITAAFQKKGATFGKILSVLFALLCLLNAVSMGCVVQIHAVSGALEGVMGIPTWVCGAILALITVVVIKKGTVGISRLTEKLVPLMSICFVVMSLAIFLLKWDRIPLAVSKIMEEAFRPDSALGGIGGFFLSKAVRFGTMRGLVSNEAGCGTAPIAHAASSSHNPTTQGILGIVEVFVDTILLCTMTALVILIGYDSVSVYGDNSIMMTIKAFSLVLGPWSEYVMCAAVLLFGFATILCWANYGMECVRYLSTKRVFGDLFIYLYGLFVWLGALATPDSVWQVADFAIGCMTLINLMVLLKMRDRVVKAGELYLFPADTPVKKKKRSAQKRSNASVRM